MRSVYNWEAGARSHRKTVDYRGADSTDTEERTQEARAAWGGRQIQGSPLCCGEQGRSKRVVASFPHVKLAAMSAPGPWGERQGQ